MGNQYRPGKRRSWIVVGFVVVAFVIIQLVPYGRDHTNPQVVAEPTWNAPQTRALTVRACYDCHSNQTVWPWYTNVAPVSWLVRRDVDDGRRKLNFSIWDPPPRPPRALARTIQRGEMPPSYYSILHPESQLSQSEIRDLIQGLEATVRVTGTEVGSEGD
jgi:hypothetical protein